MIETFLVVTKFQPRPQRLRTIDDSPKVQRMLRVRKFFVTLSLAPTFGGIDGGHREVNKKLFLKLKFT